MKKLIHLLTIFVFVTFLTSCLTVEKKKYTFEFTGENSGTLTINYINIMSTPDDGKDVSETDFDELIETYLNGDEIEKQFPNAKMLNKRLYEENGVLCGEVKMSFPDLKSVKLHQFDKKSFYIYILPTCLNNEYYVSSNGRFANTDVPVVVWEPKTKKLELTTSVSTEESQGTSLLSNYKDWK